jgi:hypothetical protein
MSLHLIKLCVGIDTVEELRIWSEAYKAKRRKQDHVTRMFPKRRDEILGGGSLYWVIKGMIACRQVIADLETVRGIDGIERCRIVFEPDVIAVRPTPRRAFQGWRYLDAAEVPPDLQQRSGISDMSEQMQRELAELGLI